MWLGQHMKAGSTELEPLEASPQPSPARRWGWLRWLVAGLALGLTLYWTDTSVAAQHLKTVKPAWLALAVLFTVPHTFVLGLRWAYTGQRLGIPLKWLPATREYYISTFLNQILPGGVVGDLLRVVRHQAANVEAGLVLRSVVLDRVSGQVVLSLTLFVSAFAWGTSQHIVGRIAMACGVLAVLLTIAAIVRWTSWGQTRWGRRIGTWITDTTTALLGPALIPQLLLSLLALAGHGLVMWACARAVGAEISVSLALLLTPWILAAVTVPVTVGGWGVREAATAGLFQWVGLSAPQGVAASLMFGAMWLLATSPGALLWGLTRHPQPSSLSADARRA